MGAGKNINEEYGVMKQTVSEEWIHYSLLNAVLPTEKNICK